MMTYQHWIDGSYTAGETTRTGDVFSPARGVVEKQVLFATAADVDTAVAAAAKAFESWSDSSVTTRWPHVDEVSLAQLNFPTAT